MGFIPAAEINQGFKLIQEAAVISQRAGSRPEKVQAVMEVVKRLGFEISKAGVIDHGDYLEMMSVDEKFGFRFLETGKILYGKLEFRWKELGGLNES